VLPSWTGYVGTNLVSYVFFNGYSLGSALMSLVSTNTPFVGAYVMEGNYAATLSAGLDADHMSNGVVSAAIAQTSLIPVAAQSLRFGVSPLWPGSVDDLFVTINGINIPFYALANRGNYIEYGGDVSGFAGMTAELCFTEQP